MASTKEAPGAYDALEKAQPDEPIFVLLARDHASPFAITEWARVRRNKAIHDQPEQPSEKDQELLRAEFLQCAEAEAVAMEMTSWRLGHAEAPQVRATYNALDKSTAEQAEADARHKREAALRHLREAAFHLNEAGDWAAAVALRELADPLFAMRDEVNGIASAAEEHREPASGD